MSSCYHIFVNKTCFKLCQRSRKSDHALFVGKDNNTMAKTTKSTLGNYDSARAFLDALLTSVVIPASVTVVDSKSGIINEGQEDQRAWASLTCVDKKLYETFASIGQEDYCPTFKVKLKNYQSENLDSLVNADIVLNKYDLSFVLDKLKQPIGLALVTELSDISLK